MSPPPNAKKSYSSVVSLAQLVTPSMALKAQLVYSLFLAPTPIESTGAGTSLLGGAGYKGPSIGT